MIQMRLESAFVHVARAVRLVDTRQGDGFNLLQ